MSEGPRSSLDHRYERETPAHGLPAAAHAPEPTPPPYPHHPNALSIANPLAPTITYGAPQPNPGQGPTVIQIPGAIPGQVVMPTPVIIQQPQQQAQPVLGIPAGSVTVINNPPPAGSPCPICGKPLGEPVAHKPHDAHPEPKLPSAPRFSKATPEVFRDGFKPLWDAAQADTAAFVVVSGCNKLLDVLLKDLEGKTHDAPAPKKPKTGFFAWWAQTTPPKATYASRIEALQKKGYLLRGTVDAAKHSGLAEVLTEKIDAGAVTGDMAKRYVQLLWQVADQGFEQAGWSQSGEFPKAVPGPPEPDHGHKAHAAPAHPAPPSATDGHGSGHAAGHAH